MLSDELEKTVQKALDKAIVCNHQFITLEHLLFALLDDLDAMKIFKASFIELRSGAVTSLCRKLEAPGNPLM